MSRLLAVLLVGLGLILAPGVRVSPAQTSPELERLRGEVEALKQRLDALQRELHELKAAGRAPEAPRAIENLVLSVDGAPFLGDRNAKVTVLEFSDYHCPFCARHTQQTLPALLKEYVQAGKVKYVMRDFPIESLHPRAAKAHEAAHCAGEQQKYWEMHARLFANQRDQATKDLVAHAQALGLDVAAFEQCLSSERFAARVGSDVTDGQQAGVRGTPTFFVGLTDAGGSRLKAPRVIRGAQPYQRFKQVIDSVLAQ